jgi:hypothetical protein
MNDSASFMGRQRNSLRDYARASHPLVLAMDILRALLTTAASPLGLWLLKVLVTSGLIQAPLHRAMMARPGVLGAIYAVAVIGGCNLLVLWLMTTLRNFVAITLERTNLDLAGRTEETKLMLPEWSYTREGFAIILGELQDRDGSRVPNDRSPELVPRWLFLPEIALYTGFFITGTIGSGKTSAVIYPCMDQMIGMRRFVPVRQADGSVKQLEWKFSGLVTDEKGDFTNKAAEFCKKWGRENDLIRISPGGDWLWNIVYNPNIPTWAIGYQLGWILRNFNKGAQGSDPFWENAPRELVTEYLGLLDDAESYYTLYDYLDILVDDDKQDELNERARARFANDPRRLLQVERRWKSIQRRRDGMGVNLKGSLEACARAGMDMFRQPELQKTFCPTREEYFERLPSGVFRPRANVFTGFDQILEEGKIVGLEMPKQIYYDAAIFCQVALKTQWQDSVLRRETIGPDGTPHVPPRFGERIGYCPTFLMADEAQLSATPRDGDFKAVCRSKRASVWEACQSHSSIKSVFGPNKAADADTFFQNSLTRIYLRQSDPTSMKIIQEEIGKKLVAKTTVSVTEGGNSSSMSYFAGDIVHQGIGLSSMKSVATEEKPFLEFEELKALPNNVAVVCPSNGFRTLPATITYLRPLFLFGENSKITRETPWLDWPESLRTTYDLHNIPQRVVWEGWRSADGRPADPLDANNVVTADSRLGKFVQSDQPPARPPEASWAGQNIDRRASDDGDEAEAAEGHGNAPEGPETPSGARRAKAASEPPIELLAPPAARADDVDAWPSGPDDDLPPPVDEDDPDRDPDPDLMGPPWAGYGDSDVPDDGWGSGIS